MPTPDDIDRPSRRTTRLYLQATAAFVAGLYLPATPTAPDVSRHVAEALHSWTIVFFAPVAAWRLAISGFLRHLRNR